MWTLLLTVLVFYWAGPNINTYGEEIWVLETYSSIDECANEGRSYLKSNPDIFLSFSCKETLIKEDKVSRE